jgi:hypothetical protein
MTWAVAMGDVRKHRKGLLYGSVALGPDGHLPDLQDEQREQLIISLLGHVNTPDGISFKVNVPNTIDKRIINMLCRTTK